MNVTRSGLGSEPDEWMKAYFDYFLKRMVVLRDLLDEGYILVWLIFITRRYLNDDCTDHLPYHS
jgi:hypothetical protein